MKEHLYQVALTWTGNKGLGTSNYRAYDRAYEIEVTGKPIITGSSDPAFRGDRTKYNPEELFVAAISSCHLLWYLHLCADAGIVVVSYRDRAWGKMCEQDPGGRFTEVILKPEVVISANSDPQKAEQLHHKAHEHCFIANSVNFPITCQPLVSLVS